ncbi:hypothetical protein HD554DRAFT_2213418 [Boletus coccyginus]|nr:hypothetical protein HD554DRAFT_2213418 [Boletus coccyginus]
MKYSAWIAAIVLAATSFSTVLAQSKTWCVSSTFFIFIFPSEECHLIYFYLSRCGKNFMPNQTVVLPGGQFQLPPSSDEPLVAFRCSPGFRPYLQEDAKTASMIIDTPIVYQYIQGASPITLSSSGSNSSGGLGTMNVTISIGGQVFANPQVPLNTTEYQIAVDLSSLQTQKTAYQVTCTATYQGETTTTPNHVKPYFSASASLLYLPDTNGSVVKTDLRTGTLWARPANGTGGPFQPFIPQGFYVSFDQYLAKNLSIIDQLKADGFNTIHPIPPYDDAALFQQVANRAAALGLYIIYDMRSSYQNSSLVAAQVATYSSLPNLLLWETAHEPDGNSDPFNAARDAYDLIYEMDGYHPVSIVLNCQDYNFAPYVEGADIVLEDAYPIGINATFSPVWHTPCTPYFGHCGCDNCQGSIYDIKTRIQTFKDRLDILGYDRTKAVWTTPQAIASVGAYWNTVPTGQQWSAMGITSFSHGATGKELRRHSCGVHVHALSLGSMSFQYPTVTGNSTTIEGTSVAFTRVIAEYVQPFIANPKVTHETYDIDGVDASVWWNGTAYLYISANLVNAEVHVPWASVGLHGITSNDTSQVHRIFSVTQNTNVTGFNYRPGGVGIYIATPPPQ